ncbi:MAG: helix-turn-helix transcriptional regulator [Phycisphaerales bacterium]|nr:helix-turn-helix transcriptional regulator [Phycisphaerales bacterium]
MSLQRAARRGPAQNPSFEGLTIAATPAHPVEAGRRPVVRPVSVASAPPIEDLDAESPALSPHDTRAENCNWTLELLPAERSYLVHAFSSLTSRERDVVFAICEGGSNHSIAERLAIALPTLRTHLMRLNQKLGTTGKGDVVRFAASQLLDGYRSRALQPGKA